MSGKRRRLSPNATVRGADFNALMDMVEANQNMRVGPGLQMHRTSAGTFISQMNQGQIDGTRPTAAAGAVSFPAVVLDSLGWLDNGVTPETMPPANKYVWKYLLHICEFENDNERCMVPMDAGHALTGTDGYFYRMPWDTNGGGWSFREDQDYYMNGQLEVQGQPLRKYGWNLTEQYNNGLASGPQGNGVDIRAIQVKNPNLHLQPVPLGTIVMVTALPCIFGWGWFFNYENGIDGACGV